MLVNGRQVYADIYGYTPWSTLPIELSDIRQIEVVSGPSGALFGFNAVGGVINIVTYDPLYDDVNTASVTAGTQNLIQGTAIATFRFGDKGGMRISIGGRKNDDFTTPLDPIEMGVRQGNDRRAGDVAGHFRLAPQVESEFELSHSEAAEPSMTPYYTQLYTECARLAEAGLLHEEREQTGRRRRVYEITEQGLQALVTKPETGHIPTHYHEGGYVKKVPVDPWGNPYVYLSPGTHGDYDIISYGADGEPGGEGNNADIDSWELQ